MEIRLIGEHDQVDDAVQVLRERLNVTAVNDGYPARDRRHVRVYVHVEPRLYPHDAREAGR
jgi:hypothetical protein